MAFVLFALFFLKFLPTFPPNIAPNFEHYPIFQFGLYFLCNFILGWHFCHFNFFFKYLSPLSSSSPSSFPPSLRALEFGAIIITVDGMSFFSAQRTFYSGIILHLDSNIKLQCYEDYVYIYVYNVNGNEINFICIMLIVLLVSYFSFSKCNV